MGSIRCKVNFCFRFTIIILIIFLFSCGGGGSSNPNSSNNNGSNNNSVIIEDIPNSYLIETPYYIESSDNNYLYLATDYSLLQIDKVTGAKRTLFGNMLEGDVFSWRGVLQYPFGLQLKDGYLYAGNNNGRVMRVYTGIDSFNAIEQFLPYLPGAINFTWMVGNSTTLFYNGEGGIYAKNYSIVNPPILLAPITSWFNAVATDNALFYISGAYELIRFDLITHQFSTIKSNITLQIGMSKPAPMAIYGSKLYWMDGNSVYSMDINTSLPHFIATINTGERFPELVADDQYVYVKAVTLGTAQGTIYKISIGTGTITDLAISFPVAPCGLAIVGGKLYFGIIYIGLQLYSISDTGITTKVFDSIGTDLGPIRSSSYGQLIYYDSKIIVQTGYKLLIYDTLSGNYEIIFPLVYTDMMYAQGGKLYVGSSAWILRVLSMPIDSKLREFDDIYPSFSVNAPEIYSVTSLTSDQSNIYWLTKVTDISSLAIKYRIAKANLDGSNFQLLYESQSELRDLTIHNGMLFFTGNNLFADSRWELASMPLTGGAPSLVGELLLDPKTFYKQGIFYITDTVDYSTRSLFAINVDNNSIIELLSGLVYDDQFSDDTYVDVSQNWLYVAQQKMLQNQMPYKKLSRYKNISFGNIGSEQVIINPNIDVGGFIITSISSDGKYLYYLHDKLKKVKE